MKPKEMLLNIAKAMGIHVNSEALIMNKEDMVDLLINKKAYVEGDRATLLAMGEKALGLMTQAFGKPDPAEDDEEKAKKKKAAVPPPAANADDAAVEAIVNAVVARIGAAAPTLNAEDRAAIDAAKAITANARRATVARIVGNSAMTEESLKDMTDAQLETIANGLKPSADYTGRAAAGVTTNKGEDKVALEAMSAGTATSLTDRIKAKANGGAK